MKENCPANYQTSTLVYFASLLCLPEHLPLHPRPQRPAAVAALLLAILYCRSRHLLALKGLPEHFSLSCLFTMAPRSRTDHWAYWICSHHDPETGVLIHATGDVRNGFQFEIKRSHDFRATGNRPSKRIPLQWVDGKYFNEAAMFNHGIRKIDTLPVCAFEASLHKIEAPGKTLNTVDDKVSLQIRYL